MAIAPRPRVHGVDLDPQTRCAHYHGPDDVLAIRMHCCGDYFACRACHDALAGHEASVWPLEAQGTLALLCGECGTEQTVAAYLAQGDGCPACGTAFNPGCRRHRHLYFALPAAVTETGSGTSDVHL